jgi:hypothetical protein
VFSFAIVTLIFSLTIVTLVFLSARLYPLLISSALSLIQMLARICPKCACDRATDYTQSAFADHLAPQERTGSTRH